jgi:hypothetical protein
MQIKALLKAQRDSTMSVSFLQVVLAKNSNQHSSVGGHDMAFILK